ncbi:RloB family protein [Cytophagaceae bacterium ABcell3]|nr:RloB family protein [Cytophagaceae bacterium ABcell3]
MKRKKRGYKRDIPQELMRDYKLFAIACEGYKREPEYFKVFPYLSRRIAVDIIEDNKIDDFSHKSAPKWVLDRAIKYIEKEGLTDEDDLYFVMDVDRWSNQQIREISNYCEQFPNWHVVLSNPCFEVWLYLHKKANFPNHNTASCATLKKEFLQCIQGDITR